MVGSRLRQFAHACWCAHQNYYSNCVKYTHTILHDSRVILCVCVRAANDRSVRCVRSPPHRPSALLPGALLPSPPFVYSLVPWNTNASMLVLSATSLRGGRRAPNAIAVGVLAWLCKLRNTRLTSIIYIMHNIMWTVNRVWN